MKFKRQPREDLELNLTPLIDVVFLLLIFFMVSTTFQKESEISLQLPRANENPVESSQESIEIIINAAGRYYINDQELVKSDVTSLQNALFKVRWRQRYSSDDPCGCAGSASVCGHRHGCCGTARYVTHVHRDFA